MIHVLFALFFLTSLFGAEDKISTHLVSLKSGELSYVATVESGEVSYTSYVVDEPNRPITFVFNGGPGSSSVWLHLGTFGPRRLVSPEEGQSANPPYQIVDNLETILDLTDLVFIDPMGTGLSKADTKEAEEKHYSINADIASVSKFIRDYLTEHQRWNSPKYLAGESYGGVRAAGVSQHLQTEFGIFLNGIIFISPAIDYQTFIFETDNLSPYYLFLPTYATTAWYHSKTPSDLTLKELADKARDFTYKTYAPALICPKCFNPEELYSPLAEITQLPLETIRKYRGKLTDDQFMTELLSSERKKVGRFDSRMTGLLDSSFPFFDPSSEGLCAIFSGGLHHYLQEELGKPTSYKILSMDVNMKWNYRDHNPWGYPNLMSALRSSLISHPNMKLFVGCGYFDLATPFATAEYCFDHLDIPNTSIQFEYYEGGHMYYTNPSARIKFKQDLIRFFERSP